MHLRVAPARIAGRLIAILVVCASFAACARSDAAMDRVELVWSLQPSRPSLSQETMVTLSVRDGRGRAIGGARLRLEAQMSHPGMAPVTAAFVERGDGVYEAPLTLSMLGDWVFVASGTLPNGSRVTGSHQVRADDTGRR